MDMCREANPGIIMNNRLYSFSGFDPSRDSVQLDLRCGDYTTPEKRLPAKGYPGIDWESCMTVGDKWGYNRYDLRYKTPAMVIRQLEECSAKGGNLLLNINPKADGSIPRPVVKVFTVVGEWMAVNGSAIYGSDPMYAVHLPEGWMCSRSGQDLNIFAPSLGITMQTTVQISVPTAGLQVPAEGVQVEVLGQPDTVVPATVNGDMLELSIPAKAWAEAVEFMPVIRVKGVVR
jgi:alpha-L-fucosidase